MTLSTRPAVENEKRRRLSNKRKAELFLKQQGRCALCGEKFNVGEVVEYDHIIPLALGVQQTGENWQALHRDCHREKTKDDIKVIAKTKRLAGETGQYARRKRNGSKLQSRGFDKTLRKKMSGEVVRND